MDLLLVLIELFARCYGRGTTSEHCLKSVVSEGSCSVLAKFSRSSGRPSRIIFAWVDSPVNVLVADSIYTKKLCSRLSSSEVLF